MLGEREEQGRERRKARGEGERETRRRDKSKDNETKTMNKYRLLVEARALRQGLLHHKVKSRIGSKGILQLKGTCIT